MTARSPRVLSVKVGDLPEFARRALANPEQYRILPITPARAESQSRNPVASDEDIALLVAYLGDRCVGYLGLLPVLLGDESGMRKVFSFSTFFVGEDYRTTGAGTILMMKAMSLGHDLFVPSFTEEAGKLYEALRFRKAGPLSYLRIRIDLPLVFSFGLDMLSRALKRKKVHSLASLVDGIRTMVKGSLDYLARPLLIRLLRSPFRRECRSMGFRPVSEVSAAAPPERETISGPPRFVRDHRVVNWMIGRPWITEDRHVELPYAFSYRRDLFRFLPFEIFERQSGEQVGYVVLSVSKEKNRTVVKILDHELTDDQYRSCLLDLAFQQARRWSADIIECGAEFSDSRSRSPLHRAVMLLRERPYCMFTRDEKSPFAGRLEEIRLGFCDGDAPFV